jgi:hypothetical protein
MNRIDKYPPMPLSWMVWGLGAILYLIGFYQRVAPAVMTSELMVSFDIDAAGLGNLSPMIYNYKSTYPLLFDGLVPFTIVGSFNFELLKQDNHHLFSRAELHATKFMYILSI